MSIVLPAISLWQPHASLLFVSDPDLRKHNETRIGRLPERYRGKRVLIHATLNTPRRLPPGLPDPHPIAVEAFGWDYRQSLPRGAVIGSVIFTDCIPAEDTEPFNEADRLAGDFSAGRFVWPVADPVLFPIPMPIKGKQGWFQVEISGSAAQGIEARQGGDREDGRHAKHESPVGAADAPITSSNPSQKDSQ